MLSTLRTRLFLTYAVIIGVVLCVVGTGLLVFIIRNPAVDRQVYARLDQAADAIVRLEVLQSPTQKRLSETITRIADQQDVRVLILSSAGEIFRDSQSEGVIRFRPQILKSIQSQRGIAFDEAKNPWLYVWRPINSEVFFVLAVPRLNRVSLLFTQRIQEILRDDLLPPLLKAGGIALFLSLVLAFWISQWVAAPLRKMAEAADRTASGSYPKVPAEGPQEVRTLARAFNAMAERVTASQQSQKDFVANVSHELKTPLTSIQGFAQAISDGTAGSPERVAQAAGVIQSETGRMHRLVLDLLDLSRLEAGILVMERSPVDMDSLLQHIIDRFAPQAAAAGVHLDYQRRSLPTLVGDGDRLMQVFTNLVDNAIKNTPEGGSVSFEAIPVETAVNVVVADSGLGISPGEIDRIFERFYQVDKSRSGGQGRGTGLGLSIAKEIVLAHGGTLTVESQTGQGCVFVVKIPIGSLDDTTVTKYRKT